MPDPDIASRAYDMCAKCGGTRHMHYGKDHEFVEADEDISPWFLLGYCLLMLGS